VNPPCSEASAPFLEREEHYSPVPPTDQLPVSKPGILPVSGVGLAWLAVKFMRTSGA